MGRDFFGIDPLKITLVSKQKTCDASITYTSVILQCIHEYCPIYLDIKSQKANQVYP